MGSTTGDGEDMQGGVEAADDGVQAGVFVEPSGSLPMALVACGLVALGGAVLWAVIALVFDYEIGWLAIGIGSVCGYAMRRFCPRSVLCAAVAVIFAICGIVLGKYITYDYAVSGEITKNILENEDSMLYLVLVDQRDNGGLSDNLKQMMAKADEDEAEYPEALVVHAKEAYSKMTGEQREALAKKVSKEAMTHISFWKIQKDNLDKYSFLWLALAVMGAWSIAYGKGGADVGKHGA